MPLKTAVAVCLGSVAVLFSIWFIIRGFRGAWPVGSSRTLGIILVVLAGAGVAWAAGPSMSPQSLVPWAWRAAMTRSKNELGAFTITLRNQTGRSAYHVQVVVSGNGPDHRINFRNPIRAGAERSASTTRWSVLEPSAIEVQWESATGEEHYFRQSYRTTRRVDDR